MSSWVTAWTIQPPEWLAALRERRSLHGDGRRVRRSFRAPYRWLMAQMERRLPEYNGRFPIWLWHRPRPDLRRPGHLPRGAAGVRVELLLQRERVLLLDFETWHYVLNGWHLSLSDAESEDWERRASASGRRRDPRWPGLRRELEESWERVFDLDALERTGTWGAIDRVQGVTDRVHLGQVRRVDTFVSR